MPRPRSYTSVFAVPRSMARSRASGGPSLVVDLSQSPLNIVFGIGAKRVESFLEIGDTRGPWLGSAAPQTDECQSDRGNEDSDCEEEQAVHELVPMPGRSPRAATSVTS